MKTVTMDWNTYTTEENHNRSAGYRSALIDVRKIVDQLLDGVETDSIDTFDNEILQKFMLATSKKINEKHRPLLGRVPYSELAMHLKIAGNPIAHYQILSENSVQIWTNLNDAPIHGLPSELLSSEIRDFEKV